MARERDLDLCSIRCRCKDPAGLQWIYLNAFCRDKDDHKLLEEYGYPQQPHMVSAAKYQRAWMAGEYDDTLPPEMRPGYRPGRTATSPQNAAMPSPDISG